jgi:hypothetical protein
LRYVEHCNHEASQLPHREVLSEAAPKNGAEKLLEGSAYAVQVGADERYILQSADYVGNLGIGQSYPSAVWKYGWIVATGLGEKRMDSGGDGGRGFLRPYLKSPRLAGRRHALVNHLGKQELAPLVEGSEGVAAPASPYERMCPPDSSLQNASRRRLDITPLPSNVGVGRGLPVLVRKAQAVASLIGLPLLSRVVSDVEKDALHALLV